jgi:hypothetical protein
MKKMFRKIAASFQRISGAVLLTLLIVGTGGNANAQFYVPSTKTDIVNFPMKYFGNKLSIPRNYLFFVSIDKGKKIPNSIHLHGLIPNLEPFTAEKAGKFGGRSTGVHEVHWKISNLDAGYSTKNFGSKSLDYDARAKTFTRYRSKHSAIASPDVLLPSLKVDIFYPKTKSPGGQIYYIEKFRNHYTFTGCAQGKVNKICNILLYEIPGYLIRGTFLKSNIQYRHLIRKNILKKMEVFSHGCCKTP